VGWQVGQPTPSAAFTPHSREGRPVRLWYPSLQPNPDERPPTCHQEARASVTASRLTTTGNHSMIGRIDMVILWDAGPAGARQGHIDPLDIEQDRWRGSAALHRFQSTRLAIGEATSVWLERGFLRCNEEVAGSYLAGRQAGAVRSDFMVGEGFDEHRWLQIVQRSDHGPQLP
jgi:hypothetical protein